MGSRPEDPFEGEWRASLLVRARRRVRRRRMGLSASGSSSSGDEEGGFGGAVGILGAGEIAAVPPAGGPDISDDDEDSEGEGTGGFFR